MTLTDVGRYSSVERISQGASQHIPVGLLKWITLPSVPLNMLTSVMWSRGLVDSLDWIAETALLSAASSFECLLILRRGVPLPLFQRCLVSGGFDMAHMMCIFRWMDGCPNV